MGGWQDKLSSNDLQTMNDSISGLAAKISGVERSVWEGMDAVQQLERVLSNVKAQGSSLEQAMREKVTTQDHQQVVDKVSSLMGKIGTVERGAAASSDRIQQMEDSVSGLGKQLTLLRKAAQGEK